ncbi:MAG: hypothetical protein QM758_24505 [Armatimonas sp.]
MFNPRVMLTVALLTATTLPALAQSRRQDDKNAMAALGVGLGIAALNEARKGNSSTALILGAGAALAGKKYEDQRKAQRWEDDRYRYDRNDRWDRDRFDNRRDGRLDRDDRWDRDRFDNRRNDRNDRWDRDRFDNRNSRWNDDCRDDRGRRDNRGRR